MAAISEDRRPAFCDQRGGSEDRSEKMGRLCDWPETGQITWNASKKRATEGNVPHVIFTFTVTSSRSRCRSYHQVMSYSRVIVLCRFTLFGESQI